jgi:hypothetical protein
MAHHTLSYRGKVEIPKHDELTCRLGSVHDRGRGYSYRLINSAECVHLYPSLNGTRPVYGRPSPSYRRTLGSYGPILHPALKAVPPRKGRHRNCEMLPCGHTGVALRGWSHLHRSPTDTPLSILRRYGSALAELNTALSPISAGWCARCPIDKLIHSVSDRGELISSKRK